MNDTARQLEDTRAAVIGMQLAQSKEALQTLITGQLARMKDLKGQIAAAKDRLHYERKPADPGWFRATQQEIKTLAISIQDLQQQLGDVNRDLRRLNYEKANAAIGPIFIDSARATLPPEVFEAILLKAQTIQQQRREAQCRA